MVTFMNHFVFNKQNFMFKILFSKLKDNLVIYFYLFSHKFPVISMVQSYRQHFANEVSFDQ